MAVFVCLRARELGTLRSVRALSVSWPALLDEQQAATRVQDLYADIRQLTKLTQLNLYGVRPLGLQLLAASLQQLFLGMHAGAGTALNLMHLTALTALSIETPVTNQEDNNTPLQLPSGVSSLGLYGSIRLLGPHMPLHVHVVDASCTNGLLILQDLRSQQQPWRLELWVSSPLSDRFAAEAGAALSACTSLTELVVQDGSQEGSLPWARHVAALTGLRELEPYVGGWCPLGSCKRVAAH